MEEDDDSLQDLVAYSKNRPRYIRTVSWEFKSERKQPKSKKRHQSMPEGGAGCEEVSKDSPSPEEKRNGIQKVHTTQQLRKISQRL